MSSSTSLPGKSQPRRPHSYSVASDDRDVAMDYKRRFDSPARHSPASSSADTVVRTDAAVTVEATANATKKTAAIDANEKEKKRNTRPPLRVIKRIAKDYFKLIQINSNKYVYCYVAEYNAYKKIFSVSSFVSTVFRS